MLLSPIMPGADAWLLVMLVSCADPEGCVCCTVVCMLSRFGAGLVWLVASFGHYVIGCVVCA